jgi:hypothetical protein
MELSKKLKFEDNDYLVHIEFESVEFLTLRCGSFYTCSNSFEANPRFLFSFLARTESFYIAKMHLWFYYVEGEPLREMTPFCAPYNPIDTTPWHFLEKSKMTPEMLAHFTAWIEHYLSSI